METYRVLVLDDYEPFASAFDSICKIFNKRYDDKQITIEVCHSIRDAIETTKLNNYWDLYILDMQMGDDKLAGLNYLACMQERPLPKVIMFTSVRSEDIVKQSVAAGACGYICKLDAVDIDIIVEAINCVLKDGTYFSESVKQFVTTL